MYAWSAFPFIRLSLSLTLGIVLTQYDWMPLDIKPFYFLIFVCVYVLAVLLLKQSELRGSISILFFVVCGWYLSEISDQTTFPDHYSHFDNPDAFVARITSDHTERTNHLRYEAEVLLVRQADSIRSVSGDLFLYIRKEETNVPLECGDIVAVDKGYFSVAPPKNPHEFNYKKYLTKLGIYAHAFVKKHEVRVIDSDPKHQIMALAYKVRSYCRGVIQKNVTDEREKAIITALLLGIKDYLDEDLKKDYSAAGAMHVLAVSGLHVGIVYLLLALIFSKWKEQKYGKVVFVVLSIAIIWVYALVTGFSPSVLRAATMFSVVIISGAFARKANIYNSLGIAAFLLILNNPNIIFAVGFQLSFAAVFGIVMIHPKLDRLVASKYQVVNYIWSITCISLAAQLATFPLTLLYFHQFPAYFLISNLVVIPAATVMMIGGMALMSVSLFSDVLASYIGFGLEHFVWLINELIGQIKYLPYPIFDWLFFDAIDTFLVYVAIVFLFLALTKYSFSLLNLSAFLFIIIGGWMGWKSYMQHQQHRLIVYELDELIGIDLISGDQALLLLDTLPEEALEVVSFQVNPNRLASGLSPMLESYHQFGDSPLVHQSDCFDLISWSEIKILLLKNSKCNRLLKSKITADLVIIRDADVSNLDQLEVKDYLVHSGLDYFETRKITSRLQEMGVTPHSLKYDGYWEMDLRKTDNN